MRLLRLAALAATIACVLPAQQDFYLTDQDRVVFYGDSITDQRLYTTFVETYVRTRFPRQNTTFVHSGWGGDRVSGGGGGPINVRLRRDVLRHQPTVVTVMLGMNDGNYRAWSDETAATYQRGYQHLLQELRAVPRVTLIRPSPYDDVTRAPTFPGGYNAVMQRFGEAVAQLASSFRPAEMPGPDASPRVTRYHVADLNASVIAALQRANQRNAAGAQQLIPDRVHPGPGGHLLMAAALLKSWNAPAVVTTVEIDAAARRMVRAENATVSGVAREGNVAWTQLDEALPFPLDRGDAGVALALASSDVVDTLNRQMLRVTGLEAGRHTLLIDGVPVGTFAQQELAAGINLAVLPTPMAHQAAQVHALTLKRATIHNTRWRSVEVPLEGNPSPEYREAIRSLDQLAGKLEAEQRAAALPVPHRYTLLRQ